MPPLRPAPDPMIRTRSRRRIRPLEQIPVWHGFDAPASPVPDGETVGFGDIGGLAQLLDGLNAEQRRAVTHGDGPLLHVPRAGAVL